MDSLIFNGKNAVTLTSVKSGNKVVTPASGEKVACPLRLIKAGDPLTVVKLQNGDKLAVKSGPNDCSDGTILLNTVYDPGRYGDGGYNRIDYYFKCNQTHTLSYSHPLIVKLKVNPVYSGKAGLWPIPYGCCWLSFGNNPDGPWTWWLDNPSMTLASEDLDFQENVTDYSINVMDRLSSALNVGFSFSYMHVVLRNTQSGYFASDVKTTLEELHVCERK